ncbi:MULTISPECIES: type 3 dihydrofolate reductase [Salinivibrio]|uniref:Dihydrofolate reductase n=1 Tax=Salinivibrio siamensis TaxID=414286 RepID=A0ABX3KCP9_9GAMM|nr:MULTISPECIES: type 3 dihydrofolate reductase [Salinivibrio]KKA45082.1 diacylglycerol kinase [Salinivibrio sp. KP-1]MPS32802.1 type 3 dihydrofolate reductase [Salinivibrio sp. VYel7]MPX90948.1 type 3 dihydrofolate reductase [Salinivibrio sp. VYel1]MPX94191.1 type 3 dihydrofolate reductase [Salinivibrio sp. VYel9]MPX97255.1 type 3 dihydrofolate reductase [Salinivibrio sp. VYel6]
MRISLVAAMANDRVIGKNNQMPWHLPADLAWFKRTTLGHPVVMGRKTFESIGRPLPKRPNIVISRDPDFQPEGVTVVSSPEQALETVVEYEEVMVIGGGTIYQAFLPRADRLYLTFIDLDVDGDTRFPQWGEGWVKTEVGAHPVDEKNAYPVTFTVWDRA